MAIVKLEETDRRGDLTMVYSGEISRDHPTCLFFLVDQSGSMDERMTTGKTKADFVADVLNKTIQTLVVSCTKADGVRSYFDVGVLGYSGDRAAPGFGGNLGGSAVHPIASLALGPVRVEDRTRIEDDGAGGVLERSVKFPVWFVPTSSGGTPMCAALTKAVEELAAWCDAHPSSYPPTILHVTDGASTDGDPERIATALRQISTADGECLLFNIHVSSSPGDSVRFPDSETGLPDSYAKLLFRMSSVLPTHVARLAVDKGYSVSEAARGFMFNADPKDIVNFFDIGTRPRLTVNR
jgi:hypothetical protein